MFSRLSFSLLKKPLTLSKTPLRSFIAKMDRSDPLIQRQEMLPQDHNPMEDTPIEETEVITRMHFVLNQFHLVDLKTLDWDAKFEQIGLDSLDQIAILTSIEQEFHTVFDDTIFETFENFNQVKSIICGRNTCS